MPPDLSNEQPHPPQEHRHQDQILAIPPGDEIGLATDPTSQQNPRKHEYTEEHRLEGTVKRTKYSDENELPTDESVILSMEDYRNLSKSLDAIDKGVTKKQQQLEAVVQDHETTKLELENVKSALSNATQAAAVEIQELKTMYEDLNSRYTLTDKDYELWTKDQCIKNQQKEHETTKLQFAELKDEAEYWSSCSRMKDEQLRAKDKTINDNLGKFEEVQRKMDDTMAKLKETEREHDSTEKQLHYYQNAMAKIKEKLESRERELGDVKAKLKNTEHEVGALRLFNDTNGAHNTELQTSAKKVKESLDKKRKNHRNTEARLLKEKADLELTCGKLREEFNTKEVEWNEQKDQMVLKLRELGGKNHRYTNKVPDDKIRELFGGLKFKIRQFIDNRLGQLPETVNQKLEPVWEEFTPNAREFLQSCVLHNLMIESYIWEWLRRTVFAPDSEVWAGELGKSFSQVFVMAQKKINGPIDDPELYAHSQYWKSSSSNFLARLTERNDNPKSCRPVAKAMVMNLAKICDTFDVDNATTDAMEIFKHARELDITLRTLQANFSLCWAPRKSGSDNHLTHRYGFKFIDSIMNECIRNPSNKAGAQAPTVDLIVAPALFKRGNNDGADYQIKTCCIKMEVVCNASNPLPQTNTSIDKRASVPQEEVRISDSSAQAIKKEEDTGEAANHAPPPPEKSIPPAKAGGPGGTKILKRKRKTD
ncbi:hypothetical protein VMCG_02171 [Cytospora schulzeri]|uniref:Uncharacterized protein n=1 Tax=Cytospora schulzeri TaxID=448051 RepID=A0A423X163_9PEZI|nr:hypothetical protein VMCG_02171 [Valsa malicola]